MKVGKQTGKCLHPGSFQTTPPSLKLGSHQLADLGMPPHPFLQGTARYFIRTATHREGHQTLHNNGLID